MEVELNTGNAPAIALEERIQECSLFDKKIEQRIRHEQRCAQPDTDLIHRLEQESLNLKDTLKRAKRLADQEKPSDLSAAQEEQ